MPIKKELAYKLGLLADKSHRRSLTLYAILWQKDTLLARQSINHNKNLNNLGKRSTKAIVELLAQTFTDINLAEMGIYNQNQANLFANYTEYFNQLNNFLYKEPTYCQQLKDKFIAQSKLRSALVSQGNPARLFATIILNLLVELMLHAFSITPYTAIPIRIVLLMTEAVFVASLNYLLGQHQGQQQQLTNTRFNQVITKIKKNDLSFQKDEHQIKLESAEEKNPQALNNVNSVAVDNGKVEFIDDTKEQDSISSMAQRQQKKESQDKSEHQDLCNTLTTENTSPARKILAKSTTEQRRRQSEEVDTTKPGSVHFFKRKEKKNKHRQATKKTPFNTASKSLSQITNTCFFNNHSYTRIHEGKNASNSKWVRYDIAELQSQMNSKQESKQLSNVLEVPSVCAKQGQNGFKFVSKVEKSKLQKKYGKDMKLPTFKVKLTKASEHRRLYVYPEGKDETGRQFFYIGGHGHRLS